jgi:hypothetical protein
MISNFDSAADMGLDSSAVTPGGKWLGEAGMTMGGTSTITLAVEATGDATQGKAAHMTGKTGMSDSADYADMSTTFSGTAVGGKPSGIDASSYTGISFKIKAGAGNMAPSVMVKLQNEDSILPCGLCNDAMTGKECYAGYTVTVAVPAGSSFGTVQVPFANAMAATWGNHTSTVVKPNGIIAMSIIVLPKVSAFDLWIDDVQFYH